MKTQLRIEELWKHHGISEQDARYVVIDCGQKEGISLHDAKILLSWKQAYGMDIPTDQLAQKVQEHLPREFQTIIALMVNMMKTRKEELKPLSFERQVIVVYKVVKSEGKITFDQAMEEETKTV